MRKQLPFVTQVKSALYDGTIISAVNYCESENEVDFRIDSASLVTKETNQCQRLKHTTYSFDVLFIHCGNARFFVFFLDLDLEISHGKSILITGSAGNCNSLTEGFDSSEELSLLHWLELN